MSKSGLVLVGGGARTAYQTGVIKAVSEMTDSKEIPFKIITGVSAGAVNGAALAYGAYDFRKTSEWLWKLWSGLKIDMVIRSDGISLISLGVKLLMNLVLGGRLGLSEANYLMDTAPLRSLLEREVNFHTIKRNIQRGVIDALAISATNYRTGTNMTFFDSNLPFEDWERSQRISKRTSLTVDHIMASTAIPLFFPPRKLDDNFYGDGSIRLISPLSSAIHLGADKVFAIGSRKPRTQDYLQSKNDEKTEKVVLADIAGLLMNSIFLDSLDSDIERMERVNRTISRMNQFSRASHPDNLREVPLLVIRPSRDLGKLASQQFHRFPFMMRHLLSGIGVSEKSGRELLSYLSFDTNYTTILLNLGYCDALEKEKEIREFLKY
ncbi:MAG: patatin-like phospholipase family protein [Nitrospinota bacterium]|nr:patatin-like phospholipase family protein [Nitrospinota bacterium]